MSESQDRRTSERPPILAVCVLVLSVVTTRVWLIAEQLRSQSSGSMSTTWTDIYGEDHVITKSIAPGVSFDDFLLDFQHSVGCAQRTFPRKP
jgi:hypothetical protein